MKEIFTHIYENNVWRNKDSVSGDGSSLQATRNISQFIPVLLNGLGIRSLLNIPSGDLHWWGQLNLDSSIEVTHADIVSSLVERTGARLLDITEDPLPRSDLVLVRDCLGHFSNESVVRALENIRVSGSTYLLATHYPDSKWKVDADIKDGGWRPINLDVQFELGNPLISILEHEKHPAYRDKTLSLWRINQ